MRMDTEHPTDGDTVSPYDFHSYRLPFEQIPRPTTEVHMTLNANQVGNSEVGFSRGFQGQHHLYRGYGHGGFLPFPSALSQSSQGHDGPYASPAELSVTNSSDDNQAVFSPGSMLSSFGSPLSNPFDTQSASPDPVPDFSSLDFNPSAWLFDQPGVAGDPHMDTFNDYPFIESGSLEAQANQATLGEFDSDGQSLWDIGTDEITNHDEQSDSSSQIIYTPPPGSDSDGLKSPISSQETVRSPRRLRARGGGAKGSRGINTRVAKRSRPSRKRSSGSSSEVPKEYICNDCPGQTFQTKSALKQHVKHQHARPFDCLFKFAGCKFSFSSKNEWKRHVSTQHLNKDYWACKHAKCCQMEKMKRGRRGAYKSPARGFKRKDLFTQHIIRMHPEATSDEFKFQSNVGSFSPLAQIHLMQDLAHHERCRLPQFMRCPVEECSKEFTGEGAFDEHMEHLSSEHIEPSTRGICEVVDFKELDHETLKDWAAREEISAIYATKDGWDLGNGDENISYALLDLFPNGL